MGVWKRWVAVMMTGTALVVVLPVSHLRAQSDDPDVITLDDNSDTSSDDAAADDGVDANGVTKLKRLIVGGDTSGADITDTPAAVSTIDAETFNERFAGDVSDAVRSKPGTYTRSAVEQHGITVNIRGMQGVGRVNTMIDGVPQNFRNLSGHGGTFDNMAYVDPNMLVGVDVNRGAVAGNEGLGTLSGSANLRTIGVDDVLLPGKDYGVLQTLSTGTNGYNMSRLTAAGWRHALSNEGTISLMGALSGSNASNYRNGDGIPYPYDAAESPTSGLFKLDVVPDSDNTLQIGGVWYNNNFAVESAGYNWFIKNQTYTAKYGYQPGDNLIDLKVNAYLNITDIAMTGITESAEFGDRQGTDTAIGFDVSNTSVWDINDKTELKFFYGGAINSDQYKGNEDRGANPDGTLIKSGAFLDTTLTYDIYALTAGIRYDAWKLNGITEYIEPGDPGCPASSKDFCNGPELSRDGGKWNPKLGLTITPRDWLQFYGTYAYTMRPPTASEMFYPGGHNFTGTGDPIQNNPNLIPELQKGLDVGINLRGDSIFMPDDKGYMKIGYFQNRISNYITYGYDDAGVAKWVNLPGVTNMEGLEFEGGYDIGRAYTTLAVTVADTKQPEGLAAGIGNDVGTLPDDFITLDAGLRFFEQRLTLGSRVRYTGESIQVFYDTENRINRPSYMLVDLYGSWKFTENFKAFFSVENLLDKSYWNSNTGTADAFTGITNGRGRTIMIGATAQF